MGPKFPHIRNYKFAVYVMFSATAHMPTYIVKASVVGSEPRDVGSYPTIDIFFLSFYFFKANKLCNNYIMTQICVLGPNLNITIKVAKIKNRQTDKQTHCKISGQL